MHTTQEGGQCVFLIADTGVLLCIGNQGAAAKFDSPYRNKYGEPLNDDDNTVNQVEF